MLRHARPKRTGYAPQARGPVDSAGEKQYSLHGFINVKQISFPACELSLSRMCLGTMNLVTPQKAQEIIRVFVDAGGNFLDTAHCYSFWTPEGSGASERSAAQALREMGLAHKVVVATKGGHPTEPGYRTVDRYLSRARVEADIDDSLGRLGVDCIDFFWLHRDDLRVPVAEIVETLNAEVRRGRIRYLGASNWSTERIREANEYAASRNLRGFVASQPEYSLAVAPAETRMQRFLGRREELAWHAATGFPVVAYSPAAKGYFATAGVKGTRYESDLSRSRLQRVVELAGRRGITANQVALAYLLSQPFPVIPIIGSTDPEHLSDGLAAAEVRLSPRELSWLETGDGPG